MNHELSFFHCASPPTLLPLISSLGHASILPTITLMHLPSRMQQKSPAWQHHLHHSPFLPSVAHCTSTQNPHMIIILTATHNINSSQCHFQQTTKVKAFQPFQMMITFHKVVDVDVLFSQWPRKIQVTFPNHSLMKLTKVCVSVTRPALTG